MASDLVFALAHDGNCVQVVTSRQIYENPTDRLPAREEQAGVTIYRVWTTHFGRMNLAGRAIDYASFYVAAFWLLLRITGSGDVIVAKTDPPLISVVAWAVARVKGAKLVNWMQDVFPDVAVALGVLKSRPLVGMLRWLRNLSMRGAEMNVVLGERMQQCICAQGVARERTTIIHNWADGRLIKPVPRQANALRAEWKLQDKFVVGYSGNMGRAHEFDTIISAMKRLQHEESIVFLFIGGGAGKEKLERAVGQSRLKNCIFRPYQSRARLAESLSFPDVHLVSLQPQLEGLIVPSKIYGIAAAGRPVIFIGDPGGEVAKLLSDCGFGFSIRVGETDVLVHHIREMAQRMDTATSMGMLGRSCFERRFDRYNSITKWTNILGQFLQLSSPPRVHKRRR